MAKGTVAKNNAIKAEKTNAQLELAVGISYVLSIVLSGS